jgi:hypothetical protein
LPGIAKAKQSLGRLLESGIIRYSSFKRSPEKFLFFDKMVVVMASEVVIPAQGAPNAGKTTSRRYTKYLDGKKRSLEACGVPCK